MKENDRTVDIFCVYCIIKLVLHIIDEIVKLVLVKEELECL